MISFFRTESTSIYAVKSKTVFSDTDIQKLVWLFGEAQLVNSSSIDDTFIGPRASMITPWSTNAVEITQNMGLSGIERIEMFMPATTESAFDPMLFQLYPALDQ